MSKALMHEISNYLQDYVRKRDFENDKSWEAETLETVSCLKTSKSH